MDRFSFTSDPASSLQPPDGNGVKAEEMRRLENLGIPVDLEKRFFELEAHNKRLNEENQMLVARNLELDEKNREQRRLIEEKEELLIVLKDEAMSMSGTEGKLNEKYERLKKKYEKVCEDHESSERKWRVELKKVEEELFDLKIQKKKIEIDLQAARKGGNVNVELLEKMKSSLEEKDVQISQLMNDCEVLEREKLKIEEKLSVRVIKLEELVAKWMQMTPEIREAKVAKVQEWCLCSGDTGMANDDLGGKVGNDDLKGSGPKYTGISTIQPKKEDLDDDDQLKEPGIEKDASCAPKPTKSQVVEINDGPKYLGISTLQPKKENLDDDDQLKCPGVEKAASCAPKPTECQVFEISDDEIEEEETQSSCFASPTTPNIAASQKRKSEAVTCSQDKQVDTKRSKYDGPRDGKLWKNVDQMSKAILTDIELCMKSLCALYRKHKSLGPWKNRLDGDKVFRPELAQSGVILGVYLTSGDPEGKLKKSLADIEREYPRRLDHCRFIVKRHCEELFEIYSNNMDPLYLP